MFLPVSLRKINSLYVDFSVQSFIHVISLIFKFLKTFNRIKTAENKFFPNKRMFYRRADYFVTQNKINLSKSVMIF